MGILTNRDLRFETKLDKKIKSLMTQEDLVTIPEGTPLSKSKKICKNCFYDIKTKLKPRVFECLELFKYQQPIEEFNLKRDYHSYKKISLYHEIRYY